MVGTGPKKVVAPKNQDYHPRRRQDIWLTLFLALATVTMALAAYVGRGVKESVDKLSESVNHGREVDSNHEGRIVSLENRVGTVESQVYTHVSTHK
ncbi:MAG: hypothetical protein M0Q43_10755 [Methanothrix sp.]|jgi:cell division protein FtsB|nr:hypothetical protein [Methanothrix sp.]